MKFKALLLAAVGFSMVLHADASDNHTGPAWQSAPKNYSINQIRDLVLIYQGGRHRPDWTAEQFVPYVTHTFADGSKDWL